MTDVTYPALIRAVSEDVLALRHRPTDTAAQALIGRLYVIADRLERGDPAVSLTGTLQDFMGRDPAEFTAGDPDEWAHVDVPAVREALARGPAGPYTGAFDLAVQATFIAFAADANAPDTPDRSEAVEALHAAVYPDTGDRDRAAAYRALRWFWLDQKPQEPEDAPVDPDTLPYRATFKGEAWINDHATAVDGALWVYPVSEAEVDGCADRGNRVFDELTDAALAPDAVRNWSGPFTIRLHPRAFVITSDQPGEPTRYADTVEEVQALLTTLLADDTGDVDGENSGWIKDLADGVEEAGPVSTWTFAGGPGVGRHLTLSRNPCPE